MTRFLLLNTVLERLNSLPLLVFVAYGLCLVALLLFSMRLRRERASLREYLRREREKD